jgi:hypothetical protein
MKNVEWLIPVIVFSVFIVGNILRILNWRNEQDKKAAARRPRVFQIPSPPPRPEPPRPPREEAVEPAYAVLPAEPVAVPPRPLGQIERQREGERLKTRPAVSAEDLQRAIRRNRARTQKRNAARVAEVVVEAVVPVVDQSPTRSLRDEAPPVAPVVAPVVFQPGVLSNTRLDPLITDLFRSPDALAQAMVLQIILSPPLCKRVPGMGASR